MASGLPEITAALEGFVGALEQVPWPFLMAFLSLLFIYLLFRRRADVFQRLAFTQREVAVLTLGSIAGWAINVPLAPLGESFLAVNVGGALVPVVLAGLWWKKDKLPLGRTTVGVVFVAAIAYAITSFDPRYGVIATFPWFFLPSIAALGYALLVSYRDPLTSVPVAYTTGSLGALLGADIVRLPTIAAHFANPDTPGLVVSIGGAGVFDMVFLAGALAMAFDLAIVAVTVRRAPEPPIVYPGRGVSILENRSLWGAYKALPDPNARERSLAAIALSNLALHEGDHATSLRMSFLAVDTVLKSGDPPLLERITQNGHATPDLLTDLRTLARSYRTHKATTPTRVEAGRANQAAKLLVSSLAPATGQPSRLEPI